MQERYILDILNTVILPKMPVQASIVTYSIETVGRWLKVSQKGVQLVTCLEMWLRYFDASKFSRKTGPVRLCIVVL